MKVEFMIGSVAWYDSAHQTEAVRVATPPTFVDFDGKGGWN